MKVSSNRRDTSTDVNFEDLAASTKFNLGEKVANKKTGSQEFSLSHGRGI